MKIITFGLTKYPQIERAFREYNLRQTTKEDDTFCLTLVREFYTNYEATLETMCKKGEKDAYKMNMNQILMRGIMVDLSNTTINKFRQGLNIIPPATSQEFYQRMTNWENPWPWLAQVIAEGEPEWLSNSSV